MLRSIDRALARRGALLWISHLTLLGCGPTDCPEPGLLEDTPLPQLCLSDRLEISPARGVLAPKEVGQASMIDGGMPQAVLSDVAENDAGPHDTESQTVASGLLRMTISGQDKSGRPREASHVDVRLKDAVGSSDNNGVARLVKSGDCARRSDSLLHCQLDVKGLATFAIEHLDRGEGRVQVCAQSADLEECADITVQGSSAIQLDLTAQATTVAPFDALGNQVPSVACAADLSTLPPLDCWNGVRRVPIVARLQNEEASTDAGVTTAIERKATVILGGNSWREAFLSASSECDPATSMGQLAELTFPAGSQSQEVALCINRNGGDFLVEGMLTSEGAKTSTLEIAADAMPAAVFPADEAMADGGAGELTLVRCDRSEIVDGGVTTSSEPSEDGVLVTLMDTESGQQAECTITRTVTP